MTYEPQTIEDERHLAEQLLMVRILRTIEQEESRSPRSFIRMEHLVEWVGESMATTLVDAYKKMSGEQIFRDTLFDEDGFFVENDALREHVDYEKEFMFGENAPLRFFMTNEERQDSENCLQFVRGRWDKRTPWGDDKLYISPGLLLYSNLEQALKTVIPDFDIYGFDYTLSVAQWEKIKKLDKGKYLHQAVAELDAWLGPRTDEEVAMTIICI